MLTDRDGCELGGDPVAECAALLRGGAIVAVKGVGGFHLACRADDNDAVGRLRERKGRESKPFALMARDLAMAARLVEFEPGGAAERALTDPSRPIVLLPRRADAPVSPLVAPGNPLLGVMLPYAPVHHLLFDHDLGPLVMTSANPSEEPLCADNTEAQRRLRSISDALLVHDRDIERRVDDSVLLAARLGTNDEIVFPLRRARGFTPAPIRWTRASAEPVLALGGEMKSTICLLRGRDAVLSEHLGELSNPAAFRNFVQAIDQFQRLLSVAPRVVAHDLHPDYASTRHALGLARDEGRRLVPVQHHHAHLAACLAENEADGPAVGVICDGTGHGLDGQVWGCEILSGDARNWRRAGRLWYYPLPGGDSAARECWRPALGLLIEAFGADWREVLEELPALLDKTLAKGVNLVASRLDAWKESIRQPGSGRPAFAPVLTSSLGRLFDAVAFLSGVCAINRHEAEAAMLLEAEVGDDGALRAEEFPWEYREPEGDSPFVLDIRPTIRAIVEGALGDVGARELSGRFHASLIAMLARGAVEAARRDGLGRVALSGGCFANRVLLRGLVERLRAAGLEVLIHRKTPPGDGCVALGQAVCAAARLESGEDL
jgi:hydrogenase maturation protein HypF